MKKNILLKGVYILGAVLLLANVILPGVVAYAEEPAIEEPKEENPANPDTPAPESNPATPEAPTNDTTNGEETEGDGTSSDSTVASETQGETPVNPETPALDKATANPEIQSEEGQPEISKASSSDDLTISSDENTCTNEKVACIGTTGYTTLMAAVSASQELDVIVLNVDNVEVTDFNVPAGKSFTLDINGKTLILNNSNSYDYIAGNLTMKDTGNGKVIVRDSGIMPKKGGTLTIENGTFDTKTHEGDYMFYLGGGTLHIKDGTFDGWYNIINCYSDGSLALGGTVIIDGGTFTSHENDGYGNITIMGYENSSITINGGNFEAVGDDGYVLVTGK